MTCAGPSRLPPLTYTHQILCYSVVILVLILTGVYHDTRIPALAMAYGFLSVITIVHIVIDRIFLSIVAFMKNPGPEILGAVELRPVD